MKIDVSKTLMSIKKEVLKVGAEPATLKWAVVEALLATYPNENINGQEKMARFRLAQRVEIADKDLDMSVEDVAKVKELIGKYFAPPVVGPCYDLLERNA